MFVFIFYFTLLSVGQSCYWNDKCSYEYFGSKTVYEDVRGDIRDVELFKGCAPVAVWSFFRHGTRRPRNFNLANMLEAAKYKDDIIRNHLEGRGELCAQDISNLKNWTWYENVSDSTAGFLTTEGYQEMFDLGSRFHERFLPLLKELDHHHFRPTLRQRAIESAKAFVEGLGQSYFKFEITNGTNGDDVLTPYLNCTRHTKEVYYGTRAETEMSTYYKTEEFQLLLENVQKRVGLEEKLTPASVMGWYNLCRYFRAFSMKTSPWCAVFSNEELAVMEYLNDLRHYYRNGYGSPINAKLGRTVLGDLFETFKSAVQQSTKSFTGYFSHDSTLQMMYGALGLFRDYPEISGIERIPSRQWRTSFMTPFAANFVAVLYNDDTTENHYQVQFLLNEKEIHLCNTRTCSWSQFVEKFRPFHNTSLDFCHLDDSNMTQA